VDILGISCYCHDPAAVLLRECKIVAAAEEERFTRIKHDYGFPSQAIKFCLESGGIQGSDLDLVVVGEPLVVSPRGMRCGSFYCFGIDALMIDSFLLKKHNG